MSENIVYEEQVETKEYPKLRVLYNLFYPLTCIVYAIFAYIVFFCGLIFAAYDPVDTMQVVFGTLCILAAVVSTIFYIVFGTIFGKKLKGNYIINTVAGIVFMIITFTAITIVLTYI